MDKLLSYRPNHILLFYRNCSDSSTHQIKDYDGSLLRTLDNSDIEVGAQTNVSTCEITISSLREFKNQGVPGIVREAYLNHEQLHKLHCLEYNDPDFSSEYDNFEDYLNEPENYSREEVEAYQESIDTLDRWLDEHC